MLGEPGRVGPKDFDRVAGSTSGAYATRLAFLTRSTENPRVPYPLRGPAAGRADFDPNVGWLIVAAVAVVVLLIFLFIFFSFVQLWIQCLLAGAGVGMFDMVRMRLLKLDYGMIVKQKIALVQAGVSASTQETGVVPAGQRHRNSTSGAGR